MIRHFILDTNAIGNLIYGRHGVDQRAKNVRRAGARIGTCPPILGELFYGVEYSRTRDENHRMVQIGLIGLKIWPFDHIAAMFYGLLAADLRRIGRPMQIPDIQLAAVALTLGNCTVVTSDSDLSAIPGLSVENWPSG